MNFKVGDRVVYSFDIHDQTFNHFGVIKKFQKKQVWFMHCILS
mgnify:CR=1 FL=1